MIECDIVDIIRQKRFKKTFPNWYLFNKFRIKLRHSKKLVIVDFQEVYNYDNHIPRID